MKTVHVYPSRMGKSFRTIFGGLLLCMLPVAANAFSVLTHEALIDANWQKVIVPLLKDKYPKATEEDLKKAKAFAYGGAVAPDMGYYPFGSALYTNLVHYVRSGDFVQSVLNEEKNLNEYAFALGVLCHYVADIYGHPLATNRSVPLVYPKVKKKFGDVVTYAEDKTSHLRMEFGFDVLQTARGNYASKDYHDYIGFEVADSLLNRAFVKTYGLELKEIFPKLSLAIGTFRWAVKDLFPGITRAAWVIKKAELRKKQPGMTGRQFMYKMHRRDYLREYGNDREKPGFFANLLSVVIRVLPKVGPLRALKFKAPGPEAEKLFVQSFDTVLYHYSIVAKERAEAHLANRDFDTGERTVFGEYPLCDKSYAELLEALKKKDFNSVSPALKQNILHFYNSEKAVRASRDEGDKWKEINEDLASLRGERGK